MSALLIIFAKEPVPGQVKTRLCPPLSPQEAAQLYYRFLEDVLAGMQALSGVNLALAYTPPSAGDFFAALMPSNGRLVAQAETGLGERLIQAFTWGFGEGFAAVLIRNSDSPDLPGAYVREGREALLTGRADVVLGPCPDGGYYLVGLRKPCPELFHHVAWSTEAVLGQTLARARQLGLKVHLLPPWPDIDDLSELLNFLKQPLAPPAPGWRSHAWAQEHLRPYFAKTSVIDSKT